MAHLLIEDVLRDLGKDPSKLSLLEKRKYCILVDWALALSQKQNTPYLNKVDLPQDEVDKLRKGIVTALTQDSQSFVDLDKPKPDSEEMDDMFDSLAQCLNLEKGEIDTGFISDYISILSKKGLVHTESPDLQYSPFTKDVIVENITKNLNEQYEMLKSKKLFTAKRNEYFAYDSENKVLDIINLDTLSHTNKLAANHAAKLIIFYLRIMNGFKAIKAAQNIEFSQGTMLALYDKMKPLIKYLDVNNVADIQAAQLISELMKTITPRDSKDKLKSKMGEALSELLFKFPQVIVFSDPRINHPSYPDCKFQTMSNFAEIEKQKKPVDRVILISGEDLANEESMRSLEVILLKHPNENIIVTYKPEDIKIIDQYNKALGAQFTLNVVGHGSLEGEKTLNANLGPYRGSAATTGQKLAVLVNECSQVNHLRITGCFTGLLRDDAELKKYPLVPKEKYATSEISRTFTMESTSDLTDANSPFVDTSVAVHCWNAIDKKGREISMTVSPGIIEPEQSLGRMVWKSSSRSNPDHHGIKEVRITTPQGPKSKPKPTLK
ncbi:MAG: hypothetical protein AB7I18_02860 [Candidatus Berkiella sp.]